MNEDERIEVQRTPQLHVEEAPFEGGYGAEEVGEQAEGEGGNVEEIILEAGDEIMEEVDMEVDMLVRPPEPFNNIVRRAVRR